MERSRKRLERNETDERSGGDGAPNTGVDGDKRIRTVQRSAETASDTETRIRPAATRAPGRVPVERGPDHREMAAQYGIECCKDGQAEKLQRMEAEFGSETVHRWADEGMTVDTMGKPREMAAFRERQQRRSESVPHDVERQNQASLQRNQETGDDGAPAGSTGVSDAVRRVISSPGSSMDETIQREMESKMGGDFSDVRMHTGPEAAEAAESINARAFTVGNHVAFNRGEYQPETTDGKRILAHELTHVRQQNDGSLNLTPKADHPRSEPVGQTQMQPALRVSQPDDPAEREAERVADAVVDADMGATRAPVGRRESTQTEPDGDAVYRQSIDEQIEDAAEAETGPYLLGVRASLPEGELLSTEDVRLYAREQTTVWIRLSESTMLYDDDTTLGIEFMPNIGLETHSRLEPNGEFSSLRWSFGDQEVSSVRMDLGTFGIRAGLGDAESEIGDEVAALVADLLPAPMRQPGYNPYEDPDFEANIQSVVDGIEREIGGGGGGSGADLPDPADLQVYGRTTLEETVEHDVGEGTIRLVEGTRMTARLFLGDGLPDPDEGVDVDRAVIEFDSHLKVRTDEFLGIEVTAVRVDSVTLHSGGDIEMDYRLLSEDFAGLANNVSGIAEGLGGSNDLPEDFDEEHDDLREEFVEPIIEEELEPMVRELLILHRDAIPEFDLADAFGIDG